MISTTICQTNKLIHVTQIAGKHCQKTNWLNDCQQKCMMVMQYTEQTIDQTAQLWMTVLSLVWQCKIQSFEWAQPSH